MIVATFVTAYRLAKMSSAAPDPCDAEQRPSKRSRRQRNETPEQQEARLARRRLQYRARRSAETVDDREARLQRQSAATDHATVYERLDNFFISVHHPCACAYIIHSTLDELDRSRSPKKHSPISYIPKIDYFAASSQALFSDLFLDSTSLLALEVEPVFQPATCTG